MLSYECKVRHSDTYLYGGSQVTLPLNSGMFLLCRVDEFAESIQLTHRNGATTTPIGQLSPGESVIVALNDVTGISAKTLAGNIDSDVRCTVIPSV